LTGAGPGDPDLLTIRALRAIESAEALLFDALVSSEIVALAPERCIKIGVGKRGDRMSVPQEKTNALMVRLARRGLHVVRLKGGDPSVFGRVEEERAHLEAHGVPSETIPGVTAASAAAAQFNFPLTHRGEARRVVYLTARTREDGSAALDTPAVADAGATLVFYMASHIAAAVEQALLAAGRDARTPVVVVENAGSPSARIAFGALGDLGRLVVEQAFDGPTLIAVGDAVGRARGAAFERRCSLGG
jgi:uroporphyrin-III C-methyltransferase